MWNNDDGEFRGNYDEFDENDEFGELDEELQEENLVDASEIEHMFDWIDDYDITIFWEGESDYYS